MVKVTNMLDIAAAKEYALKRLEKDLPDIYCYHHIGHTRDVVVPNAIEIGQSVNLSDYELTLLETAAWFHDLGFIYDTKGHERTSSIIAAAVLPLFNYPRAAIHRIESMIMATYIPQSPPDLLSAILCDADLDVLGDPDFPTFNNLLRKEMAILGNPMSDAMWFSSQWRFVVEHSYHTEHAREKRAAGKQKNLDYLANCLANVQQSSATDE